MLINHKDVIYDSISWFSEKLKMENKSQEEYFYYDGDMEIENNISRNSSVVVDNLAENTLCNFEGIQVSILIMTTFWKEKFIWKLKFQCNAPLWNMEN